jgi:hypothetical protein
MKRMISSAWTLPYKIMIPIMLGAISIILMVSLVSSSSPLPRNAYIVVAWSVAGTLFFSWWGLGLKRVSVDDRNLYVSNWIREISIPLSGIDSVDSLYGGWRVMVRLKAKYKFGWRIVFLAKWQPFVFSPSRSVVDELRLLVKSADENLTLRNPSPTPMENL